MPDYWDYWSTERPTEYHVYPHGINILAKTTRFVFIRPGFLTVLLEALPEGRKHPCWSPDL